MGAKNPSVLSPDDLNDTDRRVLDVLHEGRATPQYVADQLDISRTYASERLKRLVEHDHVDRMAAGLYDLLDDPREDNDEKESETDVAELRGRLQDALGDRDDAQARADRLADELQDCREELEQARAGDGAAVDVQLIAAIENAYSAAVSAQEGQRVEPATIDDTVAYLERATEAMDDT